METKRMVTTINGEEDYDQLCAEVGVGFRGRIQMWDLMATKKGENSISMMQMFDVADNLAHAGRVLLKHTEEAREFVDKFKPKVAGDAGVDLYCIRDQMIEPGRYYDLPSGISICMPSDWFAEIRARSSTSKRLIHCFPGVVDAGFTGELFACVLNLNEEPIMVKRGDRLAQLIFHRRVFPEFVNVGEYDLPRTERGSKGFGSTGL